MEAWKRIRWRDGARRDAYSVWKKFCEVSVCALTEGRRLEAVGEMKNGRWCEGEKFGVWLSYDSDLSQMVGIFLDNSRNRKVNF